MTDVDQAPDGTLVGAGTDRRLYSKASLSAPWVAAPGLSCCIMAVVVLRVLRDGTILAVGTNNLLYTKSSLAAPWVHVAGSCCVINIDQMPDGTIVGVGTDVFSYTRSSVTAPWVGVGPSSCCVQSIAGKLWYRVATGILVAAVDSNSRSRIELLIGSVT